jgi:hypothetical protein
MQTGAPDLRTGGRAFGTGKTLGPHRHELEFAKNQCSDVYAAPSIGPGLSRVPSWT